MAGEQDPVAFTRAFLDQYVAANPKSVSDVSPSLGAPPGMKILDYDAFEAIASQVNQKLGFNSISKAQDYVRLTLSRKPMALRAPRRRGLGYGSSTFQSPSSFGAGDTSYFDGEQVLMESIIKNQSKLDTIDRRFLRIAQGLINARKAGNVRAMHLIPSILREYRDWKTAQRDLPFTDHDWNLWTNRAAGLESVSRSYGVTISGDEPQSFAFRRRPVPTRRSNIMGVEIAGGCGHRSDLSPRDKATLGGFASGGAFVGIWKPHVFKKVRVKLFHKGSSWIALIKGARSGLPAAVSEPQPSKQAARKLALSLIQSKGWVSI